MILKWFLIIVFSYGVITADFGTPKWLVLQITLFALPLFALYFRNENVTITAVWTGVFLVAQSLLSPFVFTSNYLTLPSNLDITIDVQGGIPGISGRQRITTDQMGYRVSGPVSYEKDDGYRVFAIGGSTTQEILLDDTRTWTRGLENWLRNDGKPTAQVINTGLSGTRAVHHLATLKKIIPLNPDVVIFLVGINDWNRHIRQHYDSEYRTLQEMLAKRVNRIRSELKLERSLLGRPLRALYAAAGLTAKRSSFEVNNGEYFSKQRGSLNKSNKISFKPDAVENEYTDTIDQIVSTCSQHQIKCMFITQPNGYQDGASKSYKDSFWMTPTDSPDFTADFSSMMHIAKLYNGHLKAVAKKTGIAICDAAAQLPPEQKYFHDDCHFTEFGSKEMSRAIQTCFAEAGL